jgi:hypothetical protein
MVSQAGGEAELIWEFSVISIQLSVFKSRPFFLLSLSTAAERGTNNWMKYRSSVTDSANGVSSVRFRGWVRYERRWRKNGKNILASGNLTLNATPISPAPYLTNYSLPHPYLRFMLYTGEKSGPTHDDVFLIGILVFS